MDFNRPEQASIPLSKIPWAQVYLFLTKDGL